MLDRKFIKIFIYRLTSEKSIKLAGHVWWSSTNCVSIDSKYGACTTLVLIILISILPFSWAAAKVARPHLRLVLLEAPCSSTTIRRPWVSNVAAIPRWWTARFHSGQPPTFFIHIIAAVVHGGTVNFQPTLKFYVFIVFLDFRRLHALWSVVIWADQAVLTLILFPLLATDWLGRLAGIVAVRLSSLALLLVRAGWDDGRKAHNVFISSVASRSTCDQLLFITVCSIVSTATTLATAIGFTIILLLGSRCTIFLICSGCALIGRFLWLVAGGVGRLCLFLSIVLMELFYVGQFHIHFAYFSILQFPLLFSLFKIINGVLETWTCCPVI